MKRVNVFLAALLSLTLLLAGCASTPEPSETPQASTAPTAAPDGNAAGDGLWKTVCGSYAWDESSQYTNSVLDLMWLDDGCVLFEFNLMEGSEAEDSATLLTVSGVLNVQEDGSGLYETASEDGESHLTIGFDLSEDGQHVTVSHEGVLPISPDGSYTFSDSGMEVSDYSATELVRYLPTAATSLNANLGAYTLNYPEGLVSGWFYPTDATFDDSGACLAKFIVAKDLSAVFRVDDDIEPVLIYGSAQPMMDAEVWPELDDAEPDESGEDEAPAELSYDLCPVVSVGTDNGTVLSGGESTVLTVELPWDLPFTLEARSSDPSIADVDENGVITAVSSGETSIAGTLTVEDGVKDFEIIITVFEDGASEE